MEPSTQHSNPQPASTAASQADEPIAELNIQPQAKQHLTLGRFGPSSPPRGFAVEPLSAQRRTNSLAVELISKGTASSYELILRVINHGSTAERIKIWQM